MNGFARPEWLATTGWLADVGYRPDIRLVDVRWRADGSGRQVYEAGHLPGAVHLDWASELVEREDAGYLQLAAPERVAEAMGRLGVGPNTTVVLYDDTLGLYASRAWWSLRVHGHDALMVLDGGVAAWESEGRPLTTILPDPPAASFTPRRTQGLRATAAEVRSLIGSEGAQLLDARPSAEYRGFGGNTKRLGHIPGAINVPVGGVVRPGTQRLRDADELREQFARTGVHRARRLVCYDGSGIGAARLAFILALLGHEDVAVYDGGWSEWGDRLDLPVER